MFFLTAGLFKTISAIPFLFCIQPQAIIQEATSANQPDTDLCRDATYLGTNNAARIARSR